MKQKAYHWLEEALDKDIRKQDMFIFRLSSAEELGMRRTPPPGVDFGILPPKVREFATYFSNRVRSPGRDAEKSSRLMRNAGIGLQVFGAILICLQIRRGDTAHFLPSMVVVAMGVLLWASSLSFPRLLARHPSRLVIQEALDNLFFALWRRKFPRRPFLLVSTWLVAMYAVEGHLGLPAVYREYAIRHGDLNSVTSVYRIVTYGFFHENLYHLVNNLLSLAIAWSAARIFASLRITCWLMAGALLAAGLTCALVATSPVVGFSGVVFGLFGYGACQMVRFRGEAPRMAFALYLGVAMAVALPTFYLPGVSVAGHVGGATAGLLFFAAQRIAMRIGPSDPASPEEMDPECRP